MENEGPLTRLALVNGRPGTHRPPLLTQRSPHIVVDTTKTPKEITESVTTPRPIAKIT